MGHFIPWYKHVTSLPSAYGTNHTPVSNYTVDVWPVWHLQRVLHPSSHPRISDVLKKGGATERERDARERQSGSTNSQIRGNREVRFTVFKQSTVSSSRTSRRARWGRTLELYQGFISSVSSYLRKAAPAPSDPESKLFSDRWINRPRVPGGRTEQGRTESPGARRPADQPPVKPWTGE